jgi:hypothetical protein
LEILSNIKERYEAGGEAVEQGLFIQRTNTELVRTEDERRE